MTRHRNLGDPTWPKPTGDSVRLVRVAPDERTCLRCYETFEAGGWCQRCGAIERVPGVLSVDIARQPPSVATVQYLNDDEYRIVR